MKFPIFFGKRGNQPVCDLYAHLQSRYRDSVQKIDSPTGQLRLSITGAASDYKTIEGHVETFYTSQNFKVVSRDGVLRMVNDEGREVRALFRSDDMTGNYEIMIREIVAGVARKV